MATKKTATKKPVMVNVTVRVDRKTAATLELIASTGYVGNTIGDAALWCVQSFMVSDALNRMHTGAGKTLAKSKPTVEPIK